MNVCLPNLSRVTNKDRQEDLKLTKICCARISCHCCFLESVELAIHQQVFLLYCQHHEVASIQPANTVIILHYNVLFYFTLYCIVLYCIVLYCIVLYCIVLYCIVLYCIVLYCIVLYCIVLYCIVLYCIVLYCIVNKSMAVCSMPCEHSWQARESKCAWWHPSQYITLSNTELARWPCE